MKIDDIRDAKNETPFVPYIIRMADGFEIPIDHPDAVAWDKENPRLLLAISQGRRYWLDAALITAIVKPTAPFPGDADEQQGAEPSGA